MLKPGFVKQQLTTKEARIYIGGICLFFVRYKHWTFLVLADHHKATKFKVLTIEKFRPTCWESSVTKIVEQNILYDGSKKSTDKNLSE